MGRIKEKQKCAIEKCDSTFTKRRNKLYCSLKCRLVAFRKNHKVGRYFKYEELCKSCQEKFNKKS